MKNLLHKVLIGIILFGLVSCEKETIIIKEVNEPWPCQLSNGILEVLYVINTPSRTHIAEKNILDLIPCGIDNISEFRCPSV